MFNHFTKQNALACVVRADNYGDAIREFDYLTVLKSDGLELGEHEWTLPKPRPRSPLARQAVREDFLYVFKPALAGRAQPSCALGPCRSAHGPARPGCAEPTDQQRRPKITRAKGSVTQEGFLVLAQRHRPHRPHQPRCAPRHRPRPRRPQQMSLRDRRGRGRRRGVPGLTRPARSMRQPGRRGRGRSDVKRPCPQHRTGTGGRHKPATLAVG